LHWAEVGLWDIHGRASFFCRSVAQHRLDARRSNSEYKYQRLDHLLGLVVGLGELGDHLRQAEVGEGEDGHWEEVEVDAMSRSCVEVVVMGVCVNRGHFAMLVFLPVEGCRVRERVSRKPLEGVEELSGHEGLCDRNQYNRSGDHSCDHRLHPKPHQDPYQLCRQLGQEA